MVKNFRPIRRILMVAVANILFCNILFAADHIDSAAAVATPEADITDVFAWMDEAGEKLNLIMNVYNGAGEDAKFSDGVQYVLNVTSGATYGATDTSTTKLICTFDEAQTASCWLGDADYANGDASSTDGLASTGGNFKVFAGRRNDPFFMEFTGFTETVAIVKGAASGLTFNDAKCPALDAGTSTTLVNQLKTGKDGVDPTNTFAGSNVLSIVVELDKTAVNSKGDILGVWASTYKK